MDAKGRTAVIANLRRILRYKGLQPTEAELFRLARETYRNFAKYLVDFFSLRCIGREAVVRIVTIENEHFLEQAFALGRGILGVSAHLSSWDVGGLSMTARGYPVTGVYFPLKSPRAAELFRLRREERGLKGIPFGKAIGGVADASRRNMFIALAGDLDFSRREDIADFCGAPARMPIGPARLCVKLKSPVIPCFTVRNPDDTFVFRLHPPIVPTETTTVEEVRERIRAEIERAVMENPTHWFVFFDFWDLEASRRLAVEGV
jgi:KDO2-lipid IV(A) lauroyltransferase